MGPGQSQFRRGLSHLYTYKDKAIKKKKYYLDSENEKILNAHLI